jgi:hypothetical protein
VSNEFAPKPHDWGGLAIIALVNAVAFFVISGEISGTAAYKTSTSGSVSIAEAAYIGSLWTRSLTYVAALLAFNVFVFGIGICARITRIHRAILWAADKDR